MLNPEDICYNSLQLAEVGSEELIQPTYNLQAAQHDFPFVRIHSFFEETDLQQPKLSTNFRHHQNRNEIKAEPIKAELNDQNNGQTTSNNSTPTARIAHTPEQKESDQSHPIPKSLPKPPSPKIKILKCSKCILLSISEYNLKEHIASKNCIPNNSRPKILCPGCPNICYSNLSLSAHLQYDHFLEPDDIKKYLNLNKLEQTSRIYLKNVECLREPLLDSQQQQPQQHQQQQKQKQQQVQQQQQQQQEQQPQKEPSMALNESNIDLNTNFCDASSLNFIDLINDDNPVFLDLQSSLPESPQLPQQQQKISIKSVKTLCGEQSNFNNFIVQENESIGNKILYNMDIGVQQQHQNDFNENNTNKKNENTRPKIYIKNVDILKEPIYLPPETNNLQSESLNFTNTVESSLPSLSINSTTNNLSTNYNTINYNHSNNFNNSNSILPYNIEQENRINYNSNNMANFNNFQYENNHQYQKKARTKIYIKNVDILKSPQISQSLEPNLHKSKSNFLHLRTDLFNEDQVSSNFVVSSAPIPELPITNDPHNYNYQDNSKQISFTNSIQNEYIESFNQNENCIESRSDVEHRNENVIIDSNSSSIQHYDLNTPQIMTPAEEYNIQQEPNNIREDNEMLFVCAEEFINSNNLQPKETADKLIQDTETDDFSNLKCDEQEKSVENVEQRSEKGRIYVSENLMQNGSNFSNTNNVLNKNKKKSKGRPLGAKSSKRNGASDQNDNKEMPSFKCNFLNKCGFKFVKGETLDYHRKCHSGDSIDIFECPECKTMEFSSWNNLHTHLWRHHQIDMELYSCDLCNFKTPILSRLLNTHSKIHSDERNYSCDQCQKSFKNSKQLKNHRRIHRALTTLELHKCNECNAVFSTVRTKKEHVCPKFNTDILQQLKCDICNKIYSSKNSFKLHRLTHETNIYKFQCEQCDYKTNDHNSFRRHKGTHNKDFSNTYQCPYCNYKCIQTNMFKKHLNHKHPDLANNIIYKCQTCSFSTINKTQYQVHLAKHGVSTINIENELREIELLKVPLETNEEQIIELPLSRKEQNDGKFSQNKIKVKSDLLLTDPKIFKY